LAQIAKKLLEANGVHLNEFYRNEKQQKVAEAPENLYSFLVGAGSFLKVLESAGNPL